MFGSVKKGAHDVSHQALRLASGYAGPARSSLCSALRCIAEVAGESRPAPALSAGVQPGRARKLYGECNRSRSAVRSYEAEAETCVRAVPTFHLLQRTGDR